MLSFFYRNSPGLIRAALLSLFVCAVHCNLFAQVSIITTCAGNGKGSTINPSGPATAAHVTFPFAVATDAEGNFYMSDYYNIIYKVDTAGIISIYGGGAAISGGDDGPATAEYLNFPVEGMVFDNAGNMYFAESGNGSIREINTSGIISTFAGRHLPAFGGDNGPATAAYLKYPSDIAFDSYGNMFIADAGNYLIRMVNTAGIITSIAGIPDSLGYSGNGGPATAAKLGNVSGITFDHSGNLLIAEGWPNNDIRKISPAGIISMVAGDTSAAYGDGMQATASKLGAVSDVTVDSAGNIYFPESDSSVIRRIDAVTGILTTVAGTKKSGFSGDGGNPLSAMLNAPSSITIDAHGRMYIADQQNKRIRRIQIVHNEGIISQDIVHHISVLPNPGNGTFCVKGKLPVNDLALRTTGMTGQVVFEQAYAVKNGDVNLVIQLPATLPTGIYVLNAISAAGTEQYLVRIKR